MAVTELTARSSGAVAVLALEGAGSEAALRSLGVAPPAPGRIRLARLESRGLAGEREVLDEALVVGVDRQRFELHLHGSPAVVERLRLELGGASLASESLEDRARQLLADAPSEVAARVLLDQSEGALRRALEWARLAEPAVARAELRALVARGRAAMPHLLTPRVVLAGPSNAGKSTLFNALVGEQRVLVDAAPGTTRDAVVERARLGLTVVELVDTAGERELPDGSSQAQVEAAGQALARSLRRSADLVLWLRPADLPGAPAPAETAQLRLLDSRADRAPGRSLARPIRAATDPAGARAMVAELIAERMGPWTWQAGQAVPFESSQLALLERASTCLARSERQRVLAPLLRIAVPRAQTDIAR
ncbi:GTPase [Engelhardtia mirabilis]|uniref:tRNA modification GTPase MnmE n=1 Tax=Engelhardtia mirabilis TaxID=2528011 RepID=A0A518BP89_9BACT|nr:tRNA modification GTPase MnmE [Planctomycetes bacterium Pla133]QDV03118.1 tRNA modification GTPase MnmE [Planctomycetes bacterium Pla86]